MSLGQIFDELNAHNYREKRRSEEKISDLQAQARLLEAHAHLVAWAFNDPKKMPKIEKQLPGLFRDDGKGSEATPQWKRQQAGMAAWVAAYNEKINGKEA